MRESSFAVALCGLLACASLHLPATALAGKATIRELSVEGLDRAATEKAIQSRADAFLDCAAPDDGVADEPLTSMVLFIVTVGADGLAGDSNNTTANADPTCAQTVMRSIRFPKATGSRGKAVFRVAFETRRAERKTSTSSAATEFDEWCGQFKRLFADQPLAQDLSKVATDQFLLARRSPHAQRWGEALQQSAPSSHLLILTNSARDVGATFKCPELETWAAAEAKGTLTRGYEDPAAKKEKERRLQLKKELRELRESRPKKE